MGSKMHAMSARRGLLAAAVAGAGLALAGGAGAQVLPATSYFLQAFPSAPHGSDPDTSFAAGSVSGSINNQDGTASGHASASSQYVSADAAAAGNTQGLGHASETYYFAVIGPQNVDVHLLINGGGHLDATGGGAVEVDENINNITNFSQTCRSGSSQCGDFTYSQSVSITSDTAVYLSLAIFAIAENGSAGGFIDPMITIDPNFVDAGLYHLEFSDGITNGSPLSPGVPEPASWALMIAGFGLAGAALRRRRSAALA